MKMVRVLMTTTNLPFSLLIRAVTWSEYSHCAIVDGNVVIEAAAFHGVVETPLKDILARSSRYIFIDIPCSDPDAVIAAAKSQLGKPYDWVGILGLSLKRDWQAKDSWFCSELVAWAFDAAGNPLFNKEGLHRVTPQHLCMLPFPHRSN